MLAIRNSLTAPMNPSSPVTARIGAHQRQDDAEEDLRVGGAVDLRGLVEVLRDGVEEALHQPGVHAQGAAEVEQHQAPGGVEPDRRPQLGDLGEHQVERHDRQELREHLDQQDAEQARRAGP